MYLNQATAARPPQTKIASFANSTQRTRQELPTVNFVNPGDTRNIDCLSVGYLSYLKIYVVGYIQTGTGASGTWDATQWPWNLLSKIAVRSNGGLEFYNTGGFSNLLVQMYHRLGFNPGVPNNLLSFGSSTRGARNAISQAPAGGTTVPSSTRIPIAVSYLVPVPSHPDLRAGLLPMQNNQTRVTAALTLGAVSDWAGAGATLGVGGSVNLNVMTQNEFFTIPADAGAQPDTNFIHRIIEDVQPWTTSGDITYRVPVNGTILRSWVQFLNNGVAQPFYATANDPTTPNFNNVQVVYGGSQVPEVYNFAHMLYQHFFDYAQLPPDGVFPFDFASGAGSIEQGISARDAYNTGRLTEFKFMVNTNVTPAANSVIKVVRQELQPRIH